ncbi:MAG: extensin family protein [Pseudomonadota bacterium]
MRWLWSRYTWLGASLLIAMAIAFRQGWIPPRYSPLPAIIVEHPIPIIVDWQLRELATDGPLCRGLVSSKHVTARPVGDRVTGDGCGWSNAVRLSRVGGARFPAAAVNCGVAGAMALWMHNVVQPAARQIFESDVISMRQMGVYNCRNIIGSAFFGNRRSQHATANAVDIGAFTLGNGKTISVLHDWNRPGPRSRFLRRVHRGACRYFRVSLGPNFNRAHRDHFHFDRGSFWRCK